MRRDGKRFGRLQGFDHGAEINRFGINCSVFRDLRSIQHFESVALEHFLSASAFECNDLTVNAFFTGAIEITQISAHEGARRRNLPGVWQQVDMKMRRAARRRWHLAPTMDQDPSNKTARALVVAKVAR